MRIPKTILGVISAWLQPQEIHVLTLLYKYDPVDVLKIAILHGAYVNDIVSYPKWPITLYFEIIYFTLAEWTVEYLDTMYKLIYQQSLSQIVGRIHRLGSNTTNIRHIVDLPVIQNITNYGVNRENVFNLLYELIFKFNCGLDLEYKMKVIKHMVTYADYYRMWLDHHCSNKIDSISKCIIETQNLHVFYYIYYNTDYTDSDNNNLRPTRNVFSGIYRYIGSAYENNNITLYNTLKINHDAINVTSLYHALKNEYYVYAMRLVNTRPTNYNNADIEMLLANLIDIKHKKQYLEFIINNMSYNKQQLLYIANGSWRQAGVFTDELYYKALQYAYDYIKNEL